MFTWVGRGWLIRGLNEMRFVVISLLLSFDQCLTHSLGHIFGIVGCSIKFLPSVVVFFFFFFYLFGAQLGGRKVWGYTHSSQLRERVQPGTRFHGDCGLVTIWTFLLQATKRRPPSCCIHNTGNLEWVLPCVRYARILWWSTQLSLLQVDIVSILGRCPHRSQVAK